MYVELEILANKVVGKSRTYFKVFNEFQKENHTEPFVLMYTFNSTARS